LKDFQLVSNKFSRHYITRQTHRGLLQITTIDAEYVGSDLYTTTRTGRPRIYCCITITYWLMWKTDTKHQQYVGLNGRQTSSEKLLLTAQQSTAVYGLRFTTTKWSKQQEHYAHEYGFGNYERENFRVSVAIGSHRCK